MRKRMMRLWRDDAGIVALEYLLVATIVGLGLVVGLAAVEGALDSELTELANAIAVLDRNSSFAGVSNPGAASPSAASPSGPQALDVPPTSGITTSTATGDSVDTLRLP